MRTFLIVLYIQSFCSTGFSENPRWKEVGTPIPAHVDLDVRWEAPLKLPSKVWVYRLMPRYFSSELISNVMTMSSFTETDKIEQNTNGMTFQSTNGNRKLSINFPSGEILYEMLNRYHDPTNVTEGVPPMSQMPMLTIGFLKKLQIDLSEVTGYFGTNKLEYTENGVVYFSNQTRITNIECRIGYFRRCVDGIPVIGKSSGFHVGEHGKIENISLNWPTLERQKAYPTVSKKAVEKFIRQGTARQGLLPGNFGQFDWKTVKSVTIKKVWPSYYSGSGEWLYPFLAFWTTVDTGYGNVDLEIDCPIFDESKP